MMALRGEYCMAMLVWPVEHGLELRLQVPARRSSRLLAPGRVSRRPDSMRWTSFLGSPVAGMK